MRSEKIREMEQHQSNTISTEDYMFQAPDENGNQPAGTASIIIIIMLLECQVIKQEDVHERPGSRASKTAG